MEEAFNKPKKQSGWRQGRYVPRNPTKYKGKLDNIIYRSSWEFKVCQFLDCNPNVLEWCSEPFSIPYIKPTDGRVHKYFVDFYAKYQNTKGEIIQEIFEVKPEKQMKPSTSRNKKVRLNETITFAVNKAKWAAATQFALKHGIKFKVYSELDLFKR